ncbi:MAG: M23 family metallopeptidase [Blautia sp.]|nr:M23 family metallopeptidase [Blautia sp.]
MRKQQYVAAVACLVAGAIGFASVYATEKAQEKKELAQQESIEQQQEELSPASHELSPQPAKQTEKTVKEPEVKVKEQTAKKEEPEDEPEPQPEPEPEPEEEPAVPTAVVDTLHFQPEDGMLWPIEGAVLLDYSMDATIYFPTLDQYRYNSAMIISGAVNDKVFSVARGKIIEVFNSEETGCTVRQDLGDGYIASYGQLKELNFDVGDIVESGQVIGYVSEPTKYYSVEGTNVYFSLQKDGTPVDPREYLPMESIDTLE